MAALCRLPGKAVPSDCNVYVLWSPLAERFYIGSTDDVAMRVRQHNEGLSRWTRRHRPWQLAWCRAFGDRTEARRFENLLKRQKAGSGFWRLTGLSPHDFGRAEHGS